MYALKYSKICSHVNRTHLFYLECRKHNNNMPDKRQQVKTCFSIFLEALAFTFNVGKRNES